MADSDIQALLDPDYKITSRIDAVLISSYYCVGRTQGHARDGWANVTASDTDAQKATAIRAKLAN